MNLMERLANTAEEASLRERYDQAAEDFNSYDQKPGLRSAVGLGSIAAGTGIGGALGKGRSLGAVGGAALGASAGLIGGVAGQVPINNHLNATQPGRAASFDKLMDVSQEVDEQGGFGQLASELMERLEKTATESSEEVEEDEVPENENDEKEEGKKAKGNEVSHAEAGEEKSAAALMTRLEKTAASLSGIKNTLTAASGKEYNAAKKTHKATVDGAAKANTVEGFKANVKGAGGDVSKVRQNLEALEKDVKSTGSAMSAAKASRNEARGKLAPAAVGAAAVGGAAAGSAATKNNQEKTASEEFMNGLYKEAATAILSIETPEVKAYRDPMDGIKFDR